MGNELSDIELQPMVQTCWQCGICRSAAKGSDRYFQCIKCAATMQTLAPATTLESTLAQRGSTYGDFTDNARVHQALLNILTNEPGYANLSDVHKSAVDVICQKLARIINGNPNYKDNWHDIQGYAKLAEERSN